MSICCQIAKAIVGLDVIKLLSSALLQLVEPSGQGLTFKVSTELPSSIAWYEWADTVLKQNPSKKQSKTNVWSLKML